MAEETKKDEEDGEGGKKKGLPPIVLVAVGAALGGAGMVFMTPPPPAHHEPSEPQPAYELREHPDLVKLHFNPKQERGSMMAKLEFQFVYKLDANHEHHIVEMIKTNWNQMYSRVLLRCRRESPASLRDPDANLHLENELVAEMSLALFPDGEAVVKQLIWKSFYVQ